MTRKTTLLNLPHQQEFTYISIFNNNNNNNNTLYNDT